MRNSMIALVFGTAGLVAGALLTNTSAAAGTSYGEDRAQIEDLQALPVRPGFSRPEALRLHLHP